MPPLSHIVINKVYICLCSVSEELFELHDTALEFGEAFIRTYLPKDQTIIEIGAQDVCGSLRQFVRPGDHYTGVDFIAGHGVDVVLSDPYTLPFEDNSVDAILSSSCLEHSEFFWELFLEMVRVTKPTGLIYLNAPSNGTFHRWPVDCWRFYPDSGRALERWAKRKGYNPAMLESFTGLQGPDRWNDFVAVFVKDEANVSLYPNRIQDSIGSFTNGLVYGSDEIRSFAMNPEDISMRWWQRATRKLKAVG